MDWFSWLTKTTLDPSLIYEYGLIFAQNELQEEDIPYFNHEFLQSMGISIAKHRLEILKISRKQKGSSFLSSSSLSISHHNPISKLVIAIKKTKRSFSNYVRMWVHREESGRLAIVPVRKSYSSSSRWKNSMMKRNKKMNMVVNSNNNKQQLQENNNSNRLLLTNGIGSPVVIESDRIHDFSSPVVYDVQKADYNINDDDEKDQDQDDDNDNGDEYWSTAFEEIRWDSMFHNLKPT